MEKIEIKPLPVRSRINLPEPIQTGKEVIKIENGFVGYADKTVLSQVNLTIEKENHIGIVGYNGAGKSTLLKTIAQRIPLVSGDLKLGYKVEWSYFAQHLTEDLILEDSVLDSLQRKAYKDTTAQEILNIAGSLLFSGEDIHKKVKVLSGGEKTRVALGQILLQKKPLLLMDEPTNHLDFDTVQSLAEALTHFKGTLLVVSHDRSFINKIAKKIIEIRDGKAELYPGSYEEYLWSLEKGILSQRNTTTTVEVKEIVKTTADKFNYKETQKKISSEIKELQRKILKTEEMLFNLNKDTERLNTLLLQTQGKEAQEYAIEASFVAKNINETEDILLQHLENLDLKEKELLKLTST